MFLTWKLKVPVELSTGTFCLTGLYEQSFDANSVIKYIQ